MFDKPLADVGKDDLDQLVTNSVPEGRALEYKQELPARGAEGTREFLADASSFANAAGGDLIFGVVEVESKPESIPGLAGINADQEIQRFENLLRDGIEPRIRGVQINAVEGFSAGPAILVRIPRSWAGPHMIKGSPRFYSRNSNGKAPLDVTEIRAAFLHSQGLADRVREFRDDRIGRMLAGETPVPLKQDARYVLHLIPVSLWGAGVQIETSTFGNRSIALPAPAGGRRPNMDGFLGFSRSREEHGQSSGYAQLFRHGAIEATDRIGVRAYEGGSSIPSESLEKDTIHGIQDYLRFFGQMNIESEIIVFLSMLNVRNCYMATGPGQSDIELLQENNLLFPEIVFPNCDNSTVPAIAQSLLDHVWQAFGFGQSPNYAGPGNWRLK